MALHVIALPFQRDAQNSSLLILIESAQIPSCKMNAAVSTAQEVVMII